MGVRIHTGTMCGNMARAAALAAATTGAALGVGGCDVGTADATTGTEAGTVTTFEAAVPATFVPHRARGGKARLKAPPSWKPTDTSGNVVLNLLTDQTRSSLNLVVVPAAAGEALDKTMAKLPDQLGHEFADFRLVRNDFIILNDLPAGRIVYEATRGGFHGKLMQVFIHKGGRIHILTYTADPDLYEREYPAVEQVLASVEIE